MPREDDSEHMADLCISACDAVLKHGSPEMKALARILLLTLAREIANETRHGGSEPTGPNNENS